MRVNLRQPRNVGRRGGAPRKGKPRMGAAHPRNLRRARHGEQAATGIGSDPDAAPRVDSGERRREAGTTPDGIAPMRLLIETTDAMEIVHGVRARKWRIVNAKEGVPTFVWVCGLSYS